MSVQRGLIIGFTQLICLLFIVPVAKLGFGDRVATGSAFGNSKDPQWGPEVEPGSDGSVSKCWTVKMMYYGPNAEHLWALNLCTVQSCENKRWRHTCFSCATVRTPVVVWELNSAHSWFHAAAFTTFDAPSVALHSITSPYLTHRSANSAFSGSVMLPLLTRLTFTSITILFTKRSVYGSDVGQLIDISQWQASLHRVRFKCVTLVSNTYFAMVQWIKLSTWFKRDLSLRTT